MSDFSSFRVSKALLRRKIWAADLRNEYNRAYI